VIVLRLIIVVNGGLFEYDNHFRVKKIKGYFLRSSEITTFSRRQKLHGTLSLSVNNIHYFSKTLLRH